MGTEGAQTNNNNVIKESVSTPSENINNTYASTTTQKNVDSNLKTVTTNLNTSSNTGNGNTTTITPTAETSQIKTVKTQNTANNLEPVSTQSTAKPENVVNNSQQAAGEITPTFTIDQISNAATALKSYVELNNKLPANVTINGTTMNMAQFLELLMTATLQINTGNKNPIPLRTYNNPTNPLDDIKSGNILAAEYLKIANDLKTYMDSTGKTPDYQYQTSLGTHLGFQNLIYMYSKILNFYNSAKYLPNFAEMKPWSSIASQSAGIIANGPTFTLNQIKDAATTIKNYVETNNKLPDTVTINGTSINISQFLELLMTATLQINTGNSNPIPLRTFNAPTNPLDDIRAGNVQTSEYLKIANDLKTYMDSTGKTPDYQYQTSLGTHLGFQNLVYMYSKILYVSKVCNYLPNFVEMKPWSSIASQSAGVIVNGPTFTIDQISAAATTIKNYVETNNKLPDTVTINGKSINMSQFLELLMTATLQINTGNKNPIPLRTYNNPTNPIDDIKSGNILAAEYLKIANDLKTYMDTTGKTPDYQYKTSLGTHLGFQNLIYMYSKILNFYNVAKYLPNYAEMKSWNFIVNPIISHARTVYLTSDNINGSTADMNRLNSIADALRSMGLNVINYGLGPNTHYSVLESSGVPVNALIVDIYGGADAGLIYEMGLSYYKNLVGNRNIFCVWMPPAVDITGLAWLPRAHDDNYSPASFTGLANPDQYLLNNGYDYIYSADLNAIISVIYKEATT